MNQNNNQKGDTEDFNKDDDQSGEDGHSQNDGDNGDDGGDKDEVVTIKKSELEKIKSDRDNYRNATLKKKAEERDLEKKQDDGGKGDDDPSKANTIDLNTVKEVAKQTFREEQAQSEKENVIEAQERLIKLHPEYAEDSTYQDLMTDFVSKRGKKSVEKIMQDFEDAILLHKRRTGKLDEYLNSERERGRQEGRLEGQISSVMGAGNVGDKGATGKTSTKLSPEGERLARGMGIDPKQAAKIDPTKDNVITKI